MYYRSIPLCLHSGIQAMSIIESDLSKKNEAKAKRYLCNSIGWIQSEALSPLATHNDKMIFMQGSRTGKDSHQERRGGTNCEDLVLFQLMLTTLFLPLQMKELDLSKTVAERSLREHKGDLIKALHALTEWWLVHAIMTMCYQLFMIIVSTPIRLHVVGRRMRMRGWLHHHVVHEVIKAPRPFCSPSFYIIR